MGGYIVKTVCPIILQEYEVDKGLCGAQESLRIRPELQIKIQVTGYAY